MNKKKLNINEAPQGYRAIKYTMPSDCIVRCEVSKKVCKKANCSSNYRGDKKEVYFIKE